MPPDYDDEIARLDKAIAAHGSDRTPDDRWRAADAVLQKAELVEDRDGEEASVPLYEEAVRRLELCAGEEPRGALIQVLNTLAVIHHAHGRGAQARAAAQGVVDSHLDDGPLRAGRSVASATLIYSQMRFGTDEADAAIALLRRVLGRYGGPDAYGHRQTAAMMNKEIAWRLGQSGRLDEGMRHYESVIESLDGATDPYCRELLAGALAGKAWLLNQQSRYDERDELCRLVVERFDRAESAEIADHVEWSQTTLDEYSRPRLRKLLRRRG